MKFIDSIQELKTHTWGNYCKKRKAIGACDDLVKNHLESIDLFRSAIDDVEKQIKAWEEGQRNNSAADYHDQIDLFKVVVDFYRLNGRLALIEMDVNTAYKHLFKAKTDYEYRFFARRIYTLMYETDKGLAMPTGQLYKKLEANVESKNLDPYKKEHSEMTSFLKQHEDELKYIRNFNEAHKFKEFEEQVNSIESLSVAKSIEIIEEYFVLLTQLNIAFMVILGALSKTIKDLFNKEV
jgi:hypothetical protein